MLGSNWTVWTAIAVGSAAGGVLRHLVAQLVPQALGSDFPWGTFFVNVSGSAVMGLLAALAMSGVPAAWSLTARHLIMTGVLGGFTTFSAFSLQTLSLAQQGLWQAAALNAGGSLVLCLGACGAGYALGGLLTR